MVHNEPTPDFNDDHLRNLVNEISSSIDFEDEFDELDQLESDSQLAAKEATIIDFLRDRATSVDKVVGVLDHIRGDITNPTMTDVLATLNTIITALPDDTPQELLTPLRHAQELAGAIGSIALSTDAEMAMVYPKKDVQVSILESSLPVSEKEALLEASNRFLDGESLNTSDPDDISIALIAAQKERQEKEDKEALGRKAGILFDNLIAKKYDIDFDSKEYMVLKGLTRTSAVIGTSSWMGDISATLSKMNIPVEEYSELVEQIITIVHHDK
jgi:hypothetical protein